MTNKIPKLANQIFFGLLMLTFTLVSCKDKKDKEKPPAPDTTVVKPLDTAAKMDTMKMDTAATKPVKTPD